MDLSEQKVSIQAIGLSHPFQVEPDAAGGFELIQGLRRLSAYRELQAETGNHAFARIPARLIPSGETMDRMYRRMVDENLIRKNVSFAEMANLARACGDDHVGGCANLDEAVNRPFASAGAQKRCDILRFSPVLRLLEIPSNTPKPSHGPRGCRWPNGW